MVLQVVINERLSNHTKAEPAVTAATDADVRVSCLFWIAEELETLALLPYNMHIADELETLALLLYSMH